MAKKIAGSRRAANRRNNRELNGEMQDMTPAYTPKAALEPLQPKTKRQKDYMSAISGKQLVFGLGPAGSGKTYVSGAMAADALKNNRVSKIIITRPAVEAGEKLGFLPGEVEEKYEPYLAPFRDVLNERLGKGHVDYLLKMGRIEPAPLAYMRGRTFKDAIVILDEAQNATPQQMKMFLTRIGENCTVVVNGDENQKDIAGMSGLTDAVSRLSFIPSVSVIRFTAADIVRSGLVQEIVEAYESRE